MRSDLPFALRPGKGEDLHFILNSWMRCARTIPPWPRLPNAAFFDETHGYKAHVVSMLKKSNVLMAVSPTDPDDIFGYIVYETEPQTIHFIYVKGEAKGLKGSSMRSMKRKVGVGVGTELVRAALPEFGKKETLATEQYRYLPQWRDWCVKYRIRFVPPTSRSSQ